MKFREILEDDVSSDSTSQGTTTDNIANVEVRLGDVIRRKQIEEGIFFPDFASHVHVAFYKGGHSDEEFKQCFNVNSLRTDVIDCFSRAFKGDSFSEKGDAFYTEPMKFCTDGCHFENLAQIIRKNCKHHHNWKFEQLKQYNTQIVFGADDTDCKVVVYQNF